MTRRTRIANVVTLIQDFDSEFDSEEISIVFTNPPRLVGYEPYLHPYLVRSVSDI